MSAIDNKLEFDYERIVILYGNATTSYLGIAAGSACLAVVIGLMSSSLIGLLWWGILMLSYLPRVYLSSAFNRKLAGKEINKENIQPWERRFIFASIAPFLSFSAATFLPYGEDALIALLYYSVVMMGLVAGGIHTYSTSLPAILLFIHLAILPAVLRLLWMQELVPVLLAVTLTVAYIVLFRLIPRQNRMLLQNIALKIKNRRQSLTDPLTGLANRRRLQIFIEDLMPLSRRQKEPFSIILLDIDYFKKYNDAHGHAAGDELLGQVSRILEECSRDQDLVVRYGGEEFLLVLPATNIPQALVLAERVKKAFSDGTAVTVSAGLAMHENGLEFDDLLGTADNNLYRAKRAGRDSIVTGVEPD